MMLTAEVSQWIASIDAREYFTKAGAPQRADLNGMLLVWAQLHAIISQSLSVAWMCISYPVLLLCHPKLRSVGDRAVGESLST